MNSQAGTRRGRIAFWALALVALLVSHDAIFLAQMGPGVELTRSLREAGHAYWATAGAVVVAVGIAAAAVTALHLVTLRRRATSLAATVETPRSYLRRAGATWLRLFVVVTVAFVIQENAEHLIAHGHAPGPGALIGPMYPLALPVIAAIALLAGLLAALVAGTESVLLAAIAAALRRSASRPPRRIARSALRDHLPRISVLGRQAAGRAPPALPA